MSRSSHISSSHIKSRASHITTGDVLDDLGFSRSEASALKIKASILEAILAEIDRRGFTQQELVKLLGYADRLGVRSSLELRPPARVSRVKSVKHTGTKDVLYA